MSSSALLRLEALRKKNTRQILCLESRMHGNVPVRFGRGRLDSLGTKGLAAYLMRKVVIVRASNPGLSAGIVCRIRHKMCVSLR
jgi:hypothetical protein